MSVLQQVTELLKGLPDAGGLLEILGGHQLPPLTDYFRPIPDGWNSPPPPASVGGMTLLPIFTTDDWVSVYCIDGATGHVYAIDPEAPWPPRQVFASCGDFCSYIFRIVGDTQSDEVKSQLRKLLRVGESE